MNCRVYEVEENFSSGGRFSHFSHPAPKTAKIRRFPPRVRHPIVVMAGSIRMNPTRIRTSLLALLLACSVGSLAQDKPDGQPEQSSAPPAATPSAQKGPDKAAAYYHFAMAHIYEEMVSMYGRADYANKAIEEYRLAIENDPTSDYLNAGLAELYARTGRIKDAVLEAQDILKRDGNNLEAHRLLGRIYLRSLGDMQSGTQSQEVLKLAIEQYEQIVKLDPKSVEDHLLLGRLYRLNNELLKAESEFKTAVSLQPNSEDAVTTLAILYNEEGDTSRALQILTAIPEQSRTAKLYSTLGYTYEERRSTARRWLLIATQSTSTRTIST